MKPIKFRIENYKSIIDSGECYFSNKLTILAGKNESGKSSVLEALEDFHQDREIRKSAIPISDENLLPKISITFDVGVEELNQVLESIGLALLQNGMEITFTKEYGSKSYQADSLAIQKIGAKSDLTKTDKEVIRLIKKIIPKVEAFDSNLKFPIYKNYQLKEFSEALEPFLSTNPGIVDIQSEISEIKENIEQYFTRISRETNFVSTIITNWLPYFILFSSFEDEFPSEISIENIAKNEWAIDLQEVSSFDLMKISSENLQERVSHENKVNVEFSEKFEEYWTQDKIKLQVKKDGALVNFWIIENDLPYYPNQRSQGQRWYLSFFVKVVARLSEDKPNIILIDEPGLYLHAKAQKDLLKVLQNNLNDSPLVFSTHSPYLITDEILENVRLIEKTREFGTKILGKIHAHATSSKETLTPILTAIGLGLNDSITNVEQKNNVVVEGPEDVFYLQAFKLLVNDDEVTNFVNGGGAGKMGYVGAILEGWGCDVLYLYDNDKGMKDGVKNLRNWYVLPELIKKVVDDDGGAIVDIFSQADFKKFVLEDAKSKIEGLNSKHLKTLKEDKVLLARKFLQATKNDQIVLDKNTLSNIKDLFKTFQKIDKLGVA